MKIKKLVWDIDKECKTGVVGETFARAVGNIQYLIMCDYSNVCNRAYPPSVYNEFVGYRLLVGFGSCEHIPLGIFNTIESAVEHAQQHYENLILSGLEEI